MTGTKKDIIIRLEQELLVLQGFKAPSVNNIPGLIPRVIENAFPNKIFPAGAVHEFVSRETEQAAATSGFAGGLLSGLMRGGKACIWISRSRTLFPPALKSFGVEPAQIIFIDLQEDKDLLWTMEEALKCEGLGAVVGEIADINFNASRRLQLAVEKSCVTGLLLRNRPRQLNTIACVARWQIGSLPSELDEDMPGVGFPAWKVELLKVRNGRPGAWHIEWRNDRFRQVYKKLTALEKLEIKKAV